MIYLIIRPVFLLFIENTNILSPRIVALLFVEYIKNPVKLTKCSYAGGYSSSNVRMQMMKI